MPDKERRQRMILDLIGAEPIATQEALSTALKSVGLETPQPTLSKDMRELGVVKIPDVFGGFRYGTPSAASETIDRLQGETLLRRELTDFVTGLDGDGNTLVVKTITGHAQGVCEAIDRAWWEEVVGTLAGENTIFVLCRGKEGRKAIEERIESMR